MVNAASPPQVSLLLQMNFFQTIPTNIEHSGKNAAEFSCSIRLYLNRYLYLSLLTQTYLFRKLKTKLN